MKNTVIRDLIKTYLEVPSSPVTSSIKKQKFKNDVQIKPREEILKIAENKVRDDIQKNLLLINGNVEKICLSCYSIDKELSPHPIFMGGLCEENCLKDFKDRYFTIGDDGKNVCCIICSEPGELTMCDNEKCTKAYCSICFNALLSKEDLKKIRNDPHWRCFLCFDEPLDEMSKLRIRDSYEMKVLELMNDNIYNIKYTDFKEKRPIRVLSLFDGIATGKYVLQKLGIEVQSYFASEIDKDAITIAKINFGESITHIGDVSLLTNKEIKDLGKIDLVLAGSPCNDFSLVNPKRRGANDSSESAKLFKKFAEILKRVRENNKNTFFLYENVCPMDKGAYGLIDSQFKEDPGIIDAIHFSPMKRKRYFWSNIPGLLMIPQFWNYKSIDEREELHLDNFLIKNLGRKARVPYVRTITSNMNSLQDLPVEEDGESKLLHITEIEEIFGFPKSYTDNFNMSQRVRLLGKSWSVPVIKTILQPLRQFFKCEE